MGLIEWRAMGLIEWRVGLIEWRAMGLIEWRVGVYHIVSVDHTLPSAPNPSCTQLVTLYNI